MAFNMDLNSLILFYEVANAQSITKAAENLRMPKSTISRKLTQLEQQVGAILLKKGSRRLSLTDIGRVLYDHCQKIVVEIEDAGLHTSELQTELRGTLRVSMPIDFGISWLSRAIAAFSLQHPEIRLEIDVNDRWIDVSDEPYDIAIQFAQIRNLQLQIHHLARLKRGFYVSPKCVEQYGLPKRITDLNNYNCVVTTHQLNEGSWTFRSKDNNKPIDVSMGVIVNNIGIARELVMDGLGLGMLPNFLCRHDIKTKRLVRVIEDWECQSLEVSATFIGRRRVPKKTRAFLDFISEQLIGDD